MKTTKLELREMRLVAWVLLQMYDMERLSFPLLRKDGHTHAVAFTGWEYDTRGHHGNFLISGIM